MHSKQSPSNSFALCMLLLLQMKSVWHRLHSSSWIADNTGHLSCPKSNRIFIQVFVMDCLVLRYHYSAWATFCKFDKIQHSTQVCNAFKTAKGKSFWQNTKLLEKFQSLVSAKKQWVLNNQRFCYGNGHMKSVFEYQNYFFQVIQQLTMGSRYFLIQQKNCK